MQDVIDTPFFMFNSKYDAWQLGNEFQSNWQTKAEQDGVLQYGLDFMQQLAPIYTGSETKHGGMITSCICHGCPWPATVPMRKCPAADSPKEASVKPRGPRIFSINRTR